MAKYAATTADNQCIFCQIAVGQIETPGLFWQNNDYMAWLAIDPNTIGYTCLIPKQHFGSDVLKMADTDLTAFIVAAKTVAQVLENYFSDVGRIGLMMEGTGIDHAHIKLVPMHGTQNLKEGKWQQVLSEQEQWFDKYPGWISSASGPLAEATDLAELAASIKQSLVD